MPRKPKPRPIEVKPEPKPITTYTTKTAAAELGCAPETVWRHVKRLKLGQMLGEGTASGILILSAADVEAIRPHVRPPGNPAMRDGTFWKKRRQAQGKRKPHQRRGAKKA